MEEAARELKNAPFRFGRIDSVAQPGVAADFGIKIWPVAALFRGGDMVEEYSGPHTGAAIVKYITDVAAKGAGGLKHTGPEAEVVRFQMSNAQGLMSHRLKVQLALFTRGKKAAKEQAIGELKAAIQDGGFATTVLGLTIDVTDPANTPVLERFFVKSTQVPAVRIAVMYPDGTGLRVLGPSEGKRAATC